MSQDWFRDVYDFHAKFGCHIGTTPAEPSTETIALRIGLIKEECEEELLPALRQGDLVEVADAVVDLCYVALGTLVSYGIDPRPIWGEVHRSNMAKTGGGKRDDGKIQKPPGWTAPDVKGLLEKQGMLLRDRQW